MPAAAVPPLGGEPVDGNTLVIEDVDDELVQQLVAQAARNGRSVDEEVHAVFAAALRRPGRPAADVGPPPSIDGAFRADAGE